MTHLTLEDEPLHWYCFSFAYYEKNGEGFATSYAGFTIQNQFTKQLIENQKREAAPGIWPAYMVLISITYLGYMSKNQFESKD
ncbi:hypothetical protein [Rhizobium phage RHph_X2_28B]|uniref:hypothetical protein n=1 Tax=Rhizobium phage RHph_X2_28B TaxID=2836086 RepID=UPI0023299D01|nr:hypothetical protein PP751_gp096 [Rhizobium phage RHph_X2_28B]QWY83551.1 hypothetical protein [Rhizobium phage RHph_X2_28B]